MIHSTNFFYFFFFLSKENNFSMFINLTLWTILWFHERLSYGFFLWHFIHSKIEFFSQLNFHRSASFYSKLTLASWATLEFDLFENWFADSFTSFLRFIPLHTTAAISAWSNKSWKRGILDDTFTITNSFEQRRNGILRGLENVISMIHSYYFPCVIFYH